MNKTKLFLILYILIPFMIAIPPVLADPAVTVVSPNGGEVISGVTTITWTAQSPENTLDFNGLIYYSLSTPFNLEQAQLIDDVNLLEVCDFDIINLRWLPDSDLNTNFLTGVTTQTVAQPAFFTTTDDNSNLNVITSFKGGGSAVVTYQGKTYNSLTNQWDANDSLLNGISIITPAVSNNAFESFEKDGTKYLLVVTSDNTASPNTILTFQGYDWNGTGWEANYDINAGLDTAIYQFSVINKTFIGQDWWLVFQNNVTDSNSWYYNDTTSAWVQYNYLGNNVGDALIGNSQSFSMFEIGTELYSVGGTASSGIIFALFTDGQWETSDINTGIIPNGRNAKFFEYNSKTYLVGTRGSYPTPIIYELQIGTFATNIQATCSLSWDISTIGNGDYYIDINAFDRTNLLSTLDSSDGAFQIINWSNDDIACSCISNCSSCILDVNTFIVTPTSKTQNVEIKIDNGSGAKNVGFKIRNSDNSGDQYKIHIADSDEYSAGVWNFESTLTWGSTNYDAIQKIWDADNERYNYFFDHLLISNEDVYYKFEYYEPAYHFESVTETYWANDSTPDLIDLNGLNSDLFVASTWANIGSTLTVPKFPAIASDLSNVSYVLQFTVKSDTASGELLAGGVADKEFPPPTTLNFFTKYTTTTVSDIENFVKIGTAVASSREIYFQNYVISERGFFTKPLTIWDSDGSDLPVMILDENKFDKYVVEGKDFLVKSEYFDPDGIIDRVEITAYIGSVVVGNRVKKWVFDVSDEDGVVPIREKVSGLIDLTANAPNRTVKLTVRLVDTNSNYYEIQSDTFTLRQFPYTPTDLGFIVTQGDQLIGQHPEGHVNLKSVATENIIGVQFIFQDSVDNNNADFNKILYKDVDFTCNAFDCSFEYEFKDYLFPSADNYRLDAWVLVSTELRKPVSPYNDLLHELKSFTVSWIAFNTARIFQTNQRNDFTYRNDEVIPLIVQLMDSSGLPETLKNRINVKLALEECDGDAGAGGDTYCRIIDLNYTPDSSIFSMATGYTYYNFRQVFVEEDFTPLSDGNYFRVKAFIEDPTGTHENIYVATLAPKCQVIDPLTFWANQLTMNIFNWGCDSGGFTNALVAIPDNNAHEQRILIDEDHAVTAPTQYWWQCTEPNSSNVYKDGLKQDVLCFVMYLLGETPIDEFRFFLGNQYSNYEQEDDALKQHVEVKVPYEYIYFNDLQLLKETLQKEHNTDWDSSNIPTVGNFVKLQADSFLGFLAPVIDIGDDALTATGLISNIGWTMGAVEAGNAVDFNFNTPIDPRTVSGFLTYRINGISVVNIQDYVEKNPELLSIVPEDFTLWAEAENINLESDPITIDVFVSDNKKVMSVESQGKIVINEVVSDFSNVNTNNLDLNSDTNAYFSIPPTRLDFILTSDLVYNHGLTFKRRYLILPFYTVLEQETFCGLFGLNCWTSDVSALVFEGDLSIFVNNWFFIMMAMIGVLFISVVYGNFKRRGG